MPELHVQILLVVGASWILWLESRVLLMFSRMLHYHLKLMTAPVPDVHPNIRSDILESCLDVCWDYSINGNEGFRAGHILIIGPARQVMKAGHIKGRGKAMWQGGGRGQSCFVQTPGGASELKKFMNFDGAHIIDSATGRIWAGQFYANQIHNLKGKGSGASAAQALSAVEGTVAFKISHDGSITEFRAGETWTEHCGNRVVPARCFPAPLEFCLQFWTLVQFCGQVWSFLQ